MSQDPGPLGQNSSTHRTTHYKQLALYGVNVAVRLPRVSTLGDGCGRGVMQRLLTGICRRAVSPGCPDSREGGILIQKRRIGLTDEAPNSG